MKLSLNDFRNITLGAAGVWSENGKIRFHRFTEKEEIFYKERDEAMSRSFSDRCSAPAGIRLAFLTNARRLRICATLKAATSRTYFSFDVFENGKLIGYLDNFKEDDLALDYTTQSFPLGTHEKSFTLAKGKTEITVYFPWSVFIDDIEIELDGEIEPIKPPRKLLSYGDSITQGYDALRPSNRYTSRLADFIGAEEFNKAIGGEIFVPGLLAERLEFTPDLITVAYGTNDWSTTDGRNIHKDAREFFTTLSKHYPDTPILAITPIWRENYKDEKPLGSFSLVEEIIKEIADDIPSARVISGFDLVGHDTLLFADLRLHPRDVGFDEYFKNLICKAGGLF